MSNKIVVGYDGSDSSKATLDFAVRLAKSQGAALVVAHVLEWSPYSFLTPNEIEERHKRRGEELERAEKAVLTPVVKGLADSGVKVSTALKYGGIADTLCDIVKAEGATQVIVGRTGNSGLSSRIFGSVAGTLAQISPVPVTIVP
ncbi:Nucleotide-binding universal stress protein, UspA family [Aliiroseovarius sediminilitoris]|uniref:Nucleotide-binding universal stress protein, UspA family n=1 Tax=Aliiroseovarius sediminilitoris TaxID=1173584 RepID=A0A1I0NLG5_9RHOB|nr:universal stress protein [Aliiroseovarius sediminilitoris]SEW02156.1 Nucleotide-binding universal stress protein, UspA family [Aliiroseovarius sediminilitoris]